MIALAVLAGVAIAVAPVLIVAGLPGRRAAALSPWRRRIRMLAVTSRAPGLDERRQWVRRLGWCTTGAVVWALTGWPITGIAVAAAGVWTPWLLGAGRVVQDRMARLEALEGWCRRMADTLVGGGAVGLAQALTVSAEHVDPVIAEPVAQLASRLRDGSLDTGAAVREFADALDDRVSDTVAAAVLLALRQQSAGVARILRQLADGVARDVRARRDIEAARAEPRQSIKMLLVIQGAVLGMLALVPSFAAPYGTVAGQSVMAILLTGTVALLVWMRRLTLGRRAPRFLGSGAAE
jgi:tight adherence protein B